MQLWQGTLYGLLAAVTFGLIPLFTLPLITAGYSIPCILFYRFTLGTITMAILLRMRHYPLFVGKRDSMKLTALGFLYILSGVPFFTAFKYLDSGIVATIQFSYPVLVVVCMVCFFKEKLEISRILAVIMAVGGVAMLSLSGETGPINLTGVGLTLLSAVLTALYVTGIQVVPLQTASGLAITLYPLLCGTVYSFFYAIFDGTLVLPREPEHWMYFILQAVVTSVVSNVALVAAVRRIGSTLAAVLGATEPVVAVSVGVLVFHESFTWRTGMGVSLIVGAVLVVMAVPYLRSHLFHR